MDTIETKYDRDFVEWTREQAKALRAAKGAGVNLFLDWDHIAEEIEDMGKSQTRELANRINTIIERLIKLQCSSAIQPRAGWETTVAREREQVRKMLGDSPSLRQLLDRMGQDEIVPARRVAERAMLAFRDQVAPFPELYSTAQILDDWYPNPPE
ncbi:MAG: DUF29 domain-containing protein [Acetobacteraceae bacterium]